MMHLMFARQSSGDHQTLDQSSEQHSPVSLMWSEIDASSAKDNNSVVMETFSFDLRAFGSPPQQPEEEVTGGHRRPDL